jgi:spore maturation protein CgeB
VSELSAPTILIAGPPFRGYLNMIASGFDACGVQPSILEWKYPKRSFVQEIMFYSSGSFRRRLAEEQDRANTLALEQAVLEMKPDYVLVMKAVELSEKTKEHCRETRTRLAMWAYDSSAEFPIIARAAPAYDLVYTYEPADLASLAKVCRPKFLPMAFDPKHYFKKDGVKKSSDICFIGAIDPYPQRRRSIKRIAARFRDKSIDVWTDSIHMYSHRRLRDLFFVGFRRNIRVHRETLDHDRINDIYNRSRVCLNIHHVQSKKAVNPRTFEVLGCGGLLVTDRKLDEIEGFEEGEGYIFYSDEADLIDKLRAAFDDESMMRFIADIGHSEGRTHTFELRARTILNDLR